MTLGRTSANKIKIKTDTPKGRRAVSCACCCRFSAFSPNPTPDLPKFKHLTVTVNSSFDYPPFNPSLPSWYLDCAPTGDGFTCGPVNNFQNTGSGSFFQKTTYFLRGSGEGCYCDVAKASGESQQDTTNYMGDQKCWLTEAFDCWLPTQYRAHSATVVDSEWTTWADENGKLFLDQKVRNAKWESSFCEGWDWQYEPVESGGLIWVPGPPITDHCPGYEPECGGYSGNSDVSPPGEDKQYLYPLGDGGFRMIVVSWYGTNFTLLLHDKLADQWPQTLEMRP